MEWLIEAVRANPIQFLSMLISTVALGVAANSLLTSRQSMKTAKQSLETAQKALAATHVPNMDVELRFGPHGSTDEKHLHLFFRNRGTVPALDLVCTITVSHEGRDHSFTTPKRERTEPNDSGSHCLQQRFVESCLELAPKVFKAGIRKTDIQLPLGVPVPKIGIGVKMNWKSPAYGIESRELPQSWELEPSSYDDRYIRDWSCRRTAEYPGAPAA